MQEDKGIQAFTVRVPDELYGRVKAYAETHGESLSEVTGKALEMFLAGAQPAPSPGPSPGPGPAPQPGPTIPAELLELPGKVQKILEYEVQMLQYVGALAGRVGELQRAVLGILAVMFPGAPLPPWGVLSAVEQVRGLTDLAQGIDASDQAPSKE